MAWGLDCVSGDEEGEQIEEELRYFLLEVTVGILGVFMVFTAAGMIMEMG